MIKEHMSLMEILHVMETQELVLPLFQRPFVWSEEQICDLFDSLLQGYPLGHIFLLEQVPPDLQLRLQCCPFHPQTSQEHQEESLQSRRKEAQVFEQCHPASHIVLDGQQRLFSFLIGISGNYLRENGPGNYESCQLYFDLYPLVELYFQSQGDLQSLGREHHQFRFYAAAELSSYQEQVQHKIQQYTILPNYKALQIPLSGIRDWGRDRRTARSEIRRFLKSVAELPKSLLDEFEDLLDHLHHHLWISEPIHNTTVSPRNSYDLLEIFSRLNQGSNFKVNDLHYAIRIIFPEKSSKIRGNLQEEQCGQHVFSRFLESTKSETPVGHRFSPQHYTAEELAELSAQGAGSEIFHELNNPSNPLGSFEEAGQGNPGNQELEESYERLVQAADDLKLSLEFLYHCYLFCEAEDPEEIGNNIRRRERALALHNNNADLLCFANCIEMLCDAIDSGNFIVKHWFQNNLHNDYVLLPVFYYFYKQSSELIDPINDLHAIDLSRIVRWIALNEVSPAIFRGGMQQLNKLWPVLHRSMRSAMAEDPEHFPLQQLQSDLGQEFSNERCLGLSDSNIASLLQNTKMKHRACIPLIALLYSHPQRIVLMQRYEERQIDFIQPQKLLGRRMLKSYQLSDEEIERFFAQRDSIVNLQWLPKRLHTEKGDIPFRQWLSNSQQLKFLGGQNQFRKKELLINFMRFHHIKTEDGIYAINTFEHFLNERKGLLYKVLKQYGQDFSDWDVQAKLPEIAFATF